ncbi:MAG: hypothetical protein M3463_01620 [Verrucomicrobiota bacterium]|nr:hypothetical protein [Verrucomicrobiota bacterium]
MLIKTYSACIILSLLLPFARPALAQEVEEGVEPSGLKLVVGITPKCPYGMEGCWRNARSALLRSEQVGWVDVDADSYNCTAQLQLKNPGFPDVKALRDQFHALLGDNYVFRGVELTLQGVLESKGGKLMLKPDGLEQSMALGPLQHKLQWNFLKQRARGPEEEERIAYQQLESKAKAGETVKVRVTGPLHISDAGLLMEVREFFVMTPSTYGQGY